MLVGLFLAVLVVSAVVRSAPRRMAGESAHRARHRALARRAGAARSRRGARAHAHSGRRPRPARRAPTRYGAAGLRSLRLSRASVGGFTLHLTSLITLLCGGLLILYLLPARIGRIAGVLRGSWPARVALIVLGLAAALILAALGLVIGVALGGTPW